MELWLHLNKLWSHKNTPWQCELWCCLSTLLPEGRSEGCQLDLTALHMWTSPQNSSTSIWHHRGSIAQPACTAIYNSLLSCHGSRRLNTFCFLTSVYRCWLQGHTSCVMHSTFVNDCASCSTWMLVAQHGNITCSSIILACLCCFEPLISNVACFTVTETSLVDLLARSDLYHHFSSP